MTQAPKGGSAMAPLKADQDQKIDNLSPATQPDASGALVEPEILERVDTNHPAVDDNPRKDMPADSNRIDFNDPTLEGPEAVKRNLADQGLSAGGKA
jgi:hypothetical protein